MVLEILLYPLHAIGFFPVTPENIKKPLIFWCFLGVKEQALIKSLYNFALQVISARNDKILTSES